MVDFQTLQIHSGPRKDPATKAISVPIYASTAFAFDDTQHVEDMITGKVQGFVYSRMGNPTCAAFEQKMTALEGGHAAVSTSTGQAALLLVVFALAKAGDNFVVSSHLFGGTYQQWKVFLPRLGIKAKFVNSSDPAEFESLIDSNTRGIFFESVANPLLEVLDIQKISEVAHRNGVPVIVDNTYDAGGYLIRPIEHGADIVVHSATKWIAGHGGVMGGVAIDSGKFPWKGNPRFPEFNEELAGFPGMILVDKGPLAMATKMRIQVLRDMGSSMNPYAAHELILGLETLSLRMEKHCMNALGLAVFLAGHSDVAWANYPTLSSNPTSETAKRLLPKGGGGVVTFAMKPIGGQTGQEVAMRVMDGLKIAHIATNLGDVRTLVIHPATTTQRQLTDQEQLANGTVKDLVRISVGIEAIADLIADFDQAIKAAVKQLS